MKVAFADSYFYLALMNPRDAGRAAAKESARAFTGRIITTQCVLVEIADAFCGARNREKFTRLLDGLLCNPQVTIVPATAALFIAASRCSAPAWIRTGRSRIV
jgi:hypothetical protein